MTEKFYPELFEKQNEKFELHLSLTENYRILFSGIFGIGKTTFIEHYFEQRKEKYNCIYISPINYSILNNADIFSYVKYDILTSLFSNKHYPLKEDYYSILKTWDSFMLDNIGKIISTAVLLIPVIGKQLNQFSNDLNKLAIDFKKYKNSKKEKEMNAISEFVSKFHNNEGGLYESNLVTLIIQEWLKDIKSTGKENILIIDDLDRIDPSHIFRLLNVFSVHFNNKKEIGFENKFGFDKVILVCDIQNIQNIFKNKFGIETDFNGYIDKFYSKEVFKFDTKRALKSIIQKFFKNTFFGSSKTEIFQPIKPYSHYIDYIVLILTSLLQSNEINIRTLNKLSDTKISIDEQFLYVNNSPVNILYNPILFSIWFCSKLLGGMNNFAFKLDRVENLNNNDRIIGSMRFFIANLAMLAKTNTENVTQEEVFKVGVDTYSINGIKISFEVRDNWRKLDKFVAHLKSLTNDEHTEDKLEFKFIDSMNWIHLLRSAVENISD